MNLFQMEGAWGNLTTHLYNKVVMPALRDIYRQHLEIYFHASQMNSQMVVLDIGCGAGNVLGMLAPRHPDIQFVGIDLSAPMLDLARRNYGHYLHLSFVRGNAQNLPFEEEHFDLVLSLASVKHWPDPLAGVQEMHRVLKTEGRFFLLESDRLGSRKSIYNFVRLWRLPKILIPLAFTYFEKIVAGQGFSVYEMEALCKQAGFQEFQMQTLLNFPAVIAQGKKTHPVV